MRLFDRASLASDAVAARQIRAASPAVRGADQMARCIDHGLPRKANRSTQRTQATVATKASPSMRQDEYEAAGHQNPARPFLGTTIFPPHQKTLVVCGG